MSFVLEFYARPNSVSAQTSSGVIFVKKSHKLGFSPISGHVVDAIDMFEWNCEEFLRTWRKL
jgi:hypothetical protein